ncbi:uncharacterized protein DSM5745_00693 [Aspergillus mulundensis]|uniref:Uncharacterized protein n=1 Tax=Aspergillus mulundensis TaxID=1810919 RepID=A0A3D8T4I4_9EURO|nr:hypothetical protein DSM5745_00693 [Aspergillus mulundensis]RDW93371.1 hypothetical protein DSM5745_00693 [Aspergillus mulundensis]
MHLSNIFSSTLLVPALASLAFAQSFNLYAYGTGIGGLPVHYADGNAVVNKGAVNAVTDAVVSFTKDNARLIGNPDSSGAAGSFSNVLLYVPGSSSSSHNVGFTTDQTSTADRVTDKFVWYGATLLIKSDDGQLTSSFYLKESDAASGQYELLWGVSGDEYISVGLRSVAPAT